MENGKAFSSVKKKVSDAMGSVSELLQGEISVVDRQFLTMVAEQLTCIYKNLLVAEYAVFPASSLKKAEKKSVEPRVNYSAIQKLYNECCPLLPRCLNLSDARKKAIKARMASGHGAEVFEKVFVKANSSSFLCGKNDRKWTANFDWLLKEANFNKVLEGLYDDRAPEGRATDSGIDQKLLEQFMRG